MSKPAQRPEPPQWIAYLGAASSVLFILTVVAGVVADLPLGLILALAAIAVVAAVATLTSRRVLRLRLRLQQLESDRDMLVKFDRELEYRVADLALYWVIGEAQRRNWKVQHDDGRVTFTSPDDDVERVPLDMIDWWEVSQKLGTLAPHHWDLDWLPPTTVEARKALLMAATAEARLNKLEEQDRPTRREMIAAIAKDRVKHLQDDELGARLHELFIKITAQGWQVDYTKESYVFKRGNVAVKVDKATHPKEIWLQLQQAPRSETRTITLPPDTHMS
jgi:hypothetical protein